jgi:fermentation-respiration switch protein FrsA (DUF1100 family)
MRTFRRVLIAVAVAAIVLYLGAVGFMMSQETRLVFRPHATLGSLRPNPPFVQVDITAGDPAVQQASTARLADGHPFAWIMRAGPDAGDRPWIIFFHGNDSTIATRLNIEHYEHLRQLGLNVFAPEYPGFGGVDGTPSEAGIEREARVAYDYLRTALRVPPQRIIIYGWSLGSGVAVDLASHVREAAVILEGAPSSIVALAHLRYPWIPVSLVVRNRFESIGKIGDVRAPLLFLHSPDDQIVPTDDSQLLFDAAHNPKQFVEVSGGHIYASEQDPRFFPAVRAFLAAHGVL